MKLTIGFSPCPNDTFIFDAMVNGKIDTRGIEFDYVLEDVETLNKWAIDEKLDVTKLSYNTFLHVAEKYALLYSGSALGKGVGPLLIAKKQIPLEDAGKLKIAIPGVHTTANLLLSLAFPQAKDKTAIIFSDIENAVLDGSYDAGLIIHENRFTYADKGLVKLIDLGDWWEHTVNAAIPLGGIVIKRSIDSEVAKAVDEIIKESLAYSWKHYPELSAFVKKHAQEMEEEVMRKHIDLYVNDYTTDLGATGEHAIATLFEKASEAGMLAKKYSKENIFY